MGVNIDALDNEDDEYVKDVCFIKDQIQLRSRSMFHRNDFVFNNSSWGRRVNKATDRTHNFTLKVLIIIISLLLGG